MSFPNDTLLLRDGCKSDCTHCFYRVFSTAPLSGQICVHSQPLAGSGFLQFQYRTAKTQIDFRQKMVCLERRKGQFVSKMKHCIATKFVQGALSQFSNLSHRSPEVIIAWYVLIFGTCKLKNNTCWVCEGLCTYVNRDYKDKETVVNFNKQPTHPLGYILPGGNQGSQW